MRVVIRMRDGDDVDHHLGKTPGSLTSPE